MLQVNKSYKNGNGNIIKIVNTLTTINLPIPDYFKHTFIGNDGRFYDESGACYNAAETLDLIESYSELPKDEPKWEYPVTGARLYLGGGGNWLGTIRYWIQCNFRNGSDVTWGSSDKLDRAFTVNEYERLAAKIAAEAINEYHQQIKHLLIKD